MTVSVNAIHAASTNALASGQVSTLVTEARRAAGYSVDDLAVTTGLVNDEIENIENGNDADPAKLKRIAAALKVPASAFYAS
jgi:transcriptional regulator with XRE-family HTH domain